jgi:hypothetical protein
MPGTIHRCLAPPRTLRRRHGHGRGPCLLQEVPQETLHGQMAQLDQIARQGVRPVVAGTRHRPTAPFDRVRLRARPRARPRAHHGLQTSGGLVPRTYHHHHHHRLPESHRREVQARTDSDLESARGLAARSQMDSAPLGSAAQAQEEVASREVVG